MMNDFYLSKQDAASEIVGELAGRPDLIIGNYSDGNLVASLLSHHLGVTQVCLPTLVGWTGFYIEFSVASPFSSLLN